MMTTDKELADAYRLVLNDRDQPIGMPNEEYKARIQQLDPPKPTWPDGTIAWVTIVDLPMKKYLGVRVGDEWRDGYGPDDLRRRLCAPSVNVKVEPLRVLGDDEIALPRDVFRDATSSQARIYARDLTDCGCCRHPAAAAVFAAYADARDAEAGDRS